LLGVNAEVFAFGQELADESVGVFVDAALPGSVRVGKVALTPVLAVRVSYRTISLPHHR
jgi:hypothetical protein